MQVIQTKLLQKIKKSKLYQEINYLDFLRISLSITKNATAILRIDI